MKYFIIRKSTFLIIISALIINGCDNDESTDNDYCAETCETDYFNAITILSNDTTNNGLILGSWRWVKSERWSFDSVFISTPESSESEVHYIFEEDSTIKYYTNCCFEAEGTYIIDSTRVISTDPYRDVLIINIDYSNTYDIQFIGSVKDTMILSQAAWDGSANIFVKEY